MSLATTSNRFRIRIITGLALAILLGDLAQARAADLNMVVVGINRYRQPGMNLKFAVNDARDIAKAFQGNRLFARKDVNILTDNQATVANINGALALLKKRATTNTYTVLYLSGHGMRDEQGRFMYPTHDYNPNRAAATCITCENLRSKLFKMPGKVLLIIDTCHSGSVVKNKHPIAPVKTNEMITISSSVSREVSLELDNIRNGAFTRAFIEALSGKADANHDRTITVGEMHRYVHQRVLALTGGKQHTITYTPGAAHNNIPLAKLATPVSPAKTVAMNGR